MAYKFQKGAFHADGLISGSSTVKAVGSLSSSGDIAVTGAIHAAQLYGGGAGITGLTVAAISGTTAQLTTGVETSGYLKVTGSTTLAGKLSSSAAAEIVGASVFVGAMKMSGTVRMESGNSLSFNGSSNTAKITNQGQNLDINAPGAIVFNAATFVSSGVGAQFVGNSIFGGNLDVSGNLVVGDSTSDTMQVKATAVFSGPEGHKLGTIITNTELTASSDRSYQIVSGGTSGITLTMPSASNTNYSYMIKRHSLMSGNVVITGSGGDAASQLIDGNASITLSTVGASVFLIADGTQWNIF